MRRTKKTNFMKKNFHLVSKTRNEWICAAFASLSLSLFNQSVFVPTVAAINCKQAHAFRLSNFCFFYLYRIIETATMATSEATAYKYLLVCLLLLDSLTRKHKNNHSDTLTNKSRNKKLPALHKILSGEVVYKDDSCNFKVHRKR